MFSFTNFAFTASLWVAIMYAIITSNKTLDFWQPMGSFTVVLGLLVCVSGQHCSSNTVLGLLAPGERTFIKYLYNSSVMGDTPTGASF
ncbi:hypothetical protein BDP27DRAFT_1447648 [Rhodocollybia butyracea]|uniref:Uncharacterized protein n=1 Tax=Rhodocollybia butyracea TaxID=206335 RepID=A0A9P5PU56_9AGAR|nr:hypothetical protein BDP27DRAFT_1447648 [Rhodocollybia butyracea]